MRPTSPLTVILLRRRPRALSLTELLVAMMIALVFMGSVVTAFIQISRATDEAEAQIRAHNRARSAIDTIARDLKRVRRDPSLAVQEFSLVSANFISDTNRVGNKVDDDRDGRVDEEVFDGLDDDSDWALASDRHAVIGPYTERPSFVSLPDWGDDKVDEDVSFSRDSLTIRIPSGGTATSPAQLITYRIGTFETSDFVLLREVVTNPGLPTETTAIEPVVFDVVSLDLLAWNVNVEELGNAPYPTPGGIDHPYWVTDYEAADQTFPALRPYGAPFGVPPMEFPVSMLISVTVSAERLPLSEIGGWPLGTTALRTTRLATVTDLEVVIKDIRYQLYVRPLG